MKAPIEIRKDTYLILFSVWFSAMLILGENWTSAIAFVLAVVSFLFLILDSSKHPNQP